MNLLLLSDTHGQNDVLKTLPATDVLIHCGDSTRYGSRDNLREFAEIFGDCDAPLKLMIAGNHDRCFQKYRNESERIVAKHGIFYLEDSAIVWKGIKFWGMPWTPIFLNWYFMTDEENLFRKWQNIPDDVDVLISHGPPIMILDRNHSGEWTGSIPHRIELSRIKPKLNVFGHIHEAYGAGTLDGIDLINCSLLNFKYEMVNQPVAYELKGIDDETTE